jgi:asparagine synthase (glutamine-hydrolysing)
MCGIAGFVSHKDFASPDSILQRMTDSIAHRGPDANRYFRQAPAYLGHRRLSIVDVASGHQPMPNEDEKIWIVYNGEVFNHADVRPELERAGHRYRTRCDTETLLHAYEQWGPESVQRFRGMFAYAVWNRETRELFCVRDRLGIKPFYYFWDGETFVFGSEIKAVLQHPAVASEFDESVLPEYLSFGYTSDERTFYRGVRKLLPGHWMRISFAGPSPKFELQQYWDVPRPRETEDRSDAEWISDCRRRVEETIRMRLMSDVPLGMFLSGGVDSSSIAAVMKRLVPDRVKTFSVGYRETAYSELGYARDTAQALDTDHHEVLIGMEDFFNVLPKLVWHEDEPITWPSSVSLYYVSKLASEHVKVVLTGEGADELFAGYSRYRFYAKNEELLRYYRVIPDPLRRAIRAQVGTSPLLGAALRRKLQHTFVGLGEDLESLYLDNFYSAFSAAEQKTLHAMTESPYGSYRKYWDADTGRSLLRRMLYADQKTYLVELLMKQDQMSMACSIESRVPLLDHTFVEFAARVPDSLKVRGSSGKHILKKAMEDIIPPDVIHRKKLGFPTPLRQWLLDPRAGRLFANLEAGSGFLAEYLNREEISRLIARHRGGQIDATDRIWRLINLQVWGDVVFGGRGDIHEGLLQPAEKAFTTS